MIKWRIEEVPYLLNKQMVGVVDNEPQNTETLKHESLDCNTTGTEDTIWDDCLYRRDVPHDAIVNAQGTPEGATVDHANAESPPTGVTEVSSGYEAGETCSKRRRTRAKSRGRGGGHADVSRSRRKSSRLSKAIAEEEQQELCLREEDLEEGSSRRVSKRRASKKKTSRETHDAADTSELTLWELVVRNRRIVSPAEAKARRQSLAARNGGLSEGESSLLAPVENILDSLFGESENSTVPASSQLSNRSGDASQDLFGPSDPLLSQAGGSMRGSGQPPVTGGEVRSVGASLSLDPEGNLLLEEPSEFDLRRGDNGAGSFMSLLEGRTVISENFADTCAVQPFSGAYKVTRGVKWQPKDEETFYAALETFGVDLMMVRTWLPHFTARQIRDKYRIEEKRHEKRIDQALRRRRQVTTVNFESIHGEIDESTHFRPSDDEDETFLKKCLPSSSVKESQASVFSRVDDVLGGLLGDVTDTALSDSQNLFSQSDAEETNDAWLFGSVFEAPREASKCNSTECSSDLFLDNELLL